MSDLPYLSLGSPKIIRSLRSTVPHTKNASRYTCLSLYCWFRRGGSGSEETRNASARTTDLSPTDDEECTQKNYLVNSQKVVTANR
jgi:hypothetical protein